MFRRESSLLYAKSNVCTFQYSQSQIFLACASVDLLALMDQTTLAAALTIVSRDLNASSESAWIAGAYFLTSTSFQLLYGRLSDVWSRKVLLVIAIGIFFFGSLAASLANTSLQLIVFRAFTGVGGGGVMTLAQFIVSDIVPLRERGKYQGILVSTLKAILKGRENPN
jgi:MFS family permease